MLASFRLHLGLALLLTLGTGSARATSTRGTEFWFCDMENVENARVSPFGIRVANPGTADAGVRVEVESAILVSSVVPAGGVRTFTFPIDRMLVGTALERKAYHLSATSPVAVWLFNPVLNAFTDDASPVLPVDALGTSYFALSYQEGPHPSSGGTLPGGLAVVATSNDRTTVTIVPRGNVRAGGPVPATPAGTPLQVMLDRFDVLQLQTDGLGQDLTGTSVVADRPVAVIGGAPCAQVPTGVEFCDHLEEQLLPVTAWGREHVAVKTRPRGNEPDYWRIVASEDATSVVLTPNPIGGPVTLQRGEWVEFATPDDIHVVANRPIQVGQYLVGRKYSPSFTTGDPSLILAVPVEQWDTDYLFETPIGYSEDYVTIVAPTGAAVTLDGAPLSAGLFTRVGVTAYSRARLALTDGPHRIAASVPVSVATYGLDLDVSYGYFVGARSDGINGGIQCDAGGPYVACGVGDVVTLDGGGSSGPGSLTYRWSALTQGLSFTAPDAPVTDVTVGGTPPHVIELTVSNGTTAAACTVILQSGGMEAPVVDCLPQVDAAPTSLGSAFVPVFGTATDDCDNPPDLINSRTGPGGDASGDYPCGDTLVFFRALDSAGNQSTCVTRVSVMNPRGPEEVSDVAAGEEAVRVAKPANNPGQLRLVFEFAGEPTEALNVYEGTIRTTGIVAYDHSPVACGVVPIALPAGRGMLFIDADPGSSHYYLVSSSNCLAESTRGRRSDGQPRPDLVTDCGPLY